MPSKVHVLHSFDALSDAAVSGAMQDMIRRDVEQRRNQFIARVIRVSVDLIVAGKIRERNGLDRWVMMCADGKPSAYAAVRQHPDFVVAVFLVSAAQTRNEAHTCRAAS